MSRPGRRAAWIGLGAAAALVGAAAALADAPPPPGPLEAAAAWRDAIGGYRSPQLVPAADGEAAILLLRDPPAAAVPPPRRAAVARAIARRQEELVPILTQLGAEVTQRYRILVNGLAVRVPLGRLPALAALADVDAVVPVTYLAPASVRAAGPRPVAGGPRAARPARGAAPAHLALIDGGIDPSHPWLGGGMGPRFPILGGADLVDGDADPRTSDTADAHGTAMAGLVLRSPALAGLPPARVPRLLAYRVVAPETVAGRTVRLARSDRVLAALEHAVDPDRDGDPSDRADVVLLGLARGFGADPGDPLARALRAADRLGAVVVVPAGNDGPTLGAVGSVGGPAAVPSALAVGALGAATTPRTARLEVEVGPAAASLGPLPLMGPDPAEGAAPVVVVPGPDGVSTGEDPAELRDEEGRSRVEGAIAVVARGGGSLEEKARAAAEAGAVGLAVWDRAGDGVFPGYRGGAGWPIPVVGLGARQGEALTQAVAGRPGLTARLVPGAVRPREPGVASFSSRGPTAAGVAKPDLVAPAVDRVTAYPGRSPDGRPRATLVSGTSAAAAQVAALALRLRVDRPGLPAVGVRSLLVQAARPVRGASFADAGAGAAAAPALRPVAVDPPVVSLRRARHPRRVTIALQDLSGRPGRYRVALETGAGRLRPVGVVSLGPGVRSGLALRVAHGSGTPPRRVLVFREGSAVPVAWAPLVAVRGAPAGAALGAPQVRVRSGLAEVQIEIGRRRLAGGRLAGATVHDVALWLVPEGGGAPLRVSGAKQRGEWPSGVYHILVARRLASGLEVPAGRYRLRVTARTHDGHLLRRDSGPFRLS